MDTLLIVGLGDVATRALPLLRTHFRIAALVRPGSAAAAARHPEVDCIVGDLDAPRTLEAVVARASHVLHTAPPPAQGRDDPRTANLLRALETRSPLPRRIVYVSTSGVYGDCGGAEIDETRPVAPASDRARRRVDAERRLSDFGRAHDVRIVVLRAPGIYAADRLPLARLRNGTPVLRDEDDVYTNHVHADDLAAMCAAALTHPGAEGVYNACDDSALKMSAWFDLLADRAGLPRPPRIGRADAPGTIPAPLLSFMSESRRLLNGRIKRDLGIALRYPTVRDGVPASLRDAG